MTDYDTIINRVELARQLGIPLSELTYVLYKKGINAYYRSFYIPKKDGTSREINASTGSLKYIQRKLCMILWQKQLEIWKEKGITPNLSHAFQKNKSIMTNARVHKSKRVVLNIDLEDFFGSFHFGRVQGFFEKNRDFKVPHEVAVILAQLSCYEGKLPQGAPSSPIITNIICNIMDIRVLKIAKKYMLDYTRYADDLTFSTNDKNFLNNYHDFIKALEIEINKSGFSINEKKTWLTYRNSKQTVTGITVNERLSADRKFRKDTRAMADHLYKRGYFIINGKEGTINQLEGRFSFIDQVDKYNRTTNLIEFKNKKDRNSREYQYKKFLFFKMFIGNNYPIFVITTIRNIMN